MNQPQFLSLRLMYGTALAVQSFDTFAFLLTSSLMRTAGIVSLPFALACWLLRDNHIQYPEVGRTVGSIFFLSNVASAMLYTWSAMQPDKYMIQPFWYLAGWRVV
ncbi:hypothetical protein BJX65DRAFT_294638 [Aspergillus insuetus]